MNPTVFLKSTSNLRWRASLAACVLSLGACNVATAPDEPSIRFTVDAAVPGADPSSPSIPQSGLHTQSANAASAPGVIVIIGRIVLPSSCYELSANVDQTGSALDVTISGRAGGEICTGAVVTRGYSLRIGSLHAGLHHVRVIHEVIGSNPESSLVLERDVRVD